MSKNNAEKEKPGRQSGLADGDSKNTGINEIQFRNWADAIRGGSRRDLARAITLVESNRPKDVEPAQQLLELILPFSGRSDRIGISGVPGVGKSTFIEVLGKELIAAGRKVAVLTIDPSSPLSGGSILGDKTRMMEFSRMDEAFIRPSPAGHTLGGVARKTREAMLLCESAGYDVVIIETVGTGQAEWRVSRMVDLFAVLMLPNAGDALQGIKRGILEMADIILVNKADGSMKEAAEQAANEYRSVMDSAEAGVSGKTVLTCSATDLESVRSCWQHFAGELSQRKKDSRFDERRNAQLLHWIRSLAEDSMQQILQDDSASRNILNELAGQVQKKKITPLHAGLAYRRKVISELERHDKRNKIPF